MDALIADRKKFHKSCFCCEHCRSKLSLGNYVSLHGHLFCLHHYKQLLKSKGNYDNGLGQTQSTGSGLTPSQDQLNWRYSISQSSISSLDTSNTLEKEFLKSVNETKQSTNKISVVWPPQSPTLKKAFKLEEDIKLTKPQWPPQDNAPKSPKHQHRKAVPRSIL